MPRVKRAVHARKKRAKVLNQAKGYYGRKKSSYRFAKEQVEHSLVYAYRDRKAKKRTFRSLWIIRINAAARENGLSYNRHHVRRGLRRHHHLQSIRHDSAGNHASCVCSILFRLHGRDDRRHRSDVRADSFHL